MLLTGGIGSGKSIVARMLQVMGYKVYDCDSWAQWLMRHDKDLVRQLKQAFGDEIYHADGTIDRTRLGSIAFADSQALSTLNGLVHPAVKRHISQWLRRLQHQGATVAFVESAIPRTSGLDKMTDEVWHVTAPQQVRVNRVVARSGITPQQVLERMAAQKAEVAVQAGERQLINDDCEPVLPQIMTLLNAEQEIKTINNNNK